MPLLPTSSFPSGILPAPYQQFWSWFQSNEQSLFNALKNQPRTAQQLLEKLSLQLAALASSLVPLVGMLNATHAELVISVEGAVQDIILAEELVNAAPVVAGWKFTALKPATASGVSINGCYFSTNNMAFYATQDVAYPDIVAITVAHDKYNHHSASTMESGVWLCLDNYLGELVAATTIDRLTIIDKKTAQEPLLPLSDLRDYLLQRQTQLDDKYKGITHNVNNDVIMAFSGVSANGQPRRTTINKFLLSWNNKPSHPWLLAITAEPKRGHTQGVGQFLKALSNDIINGLPAYAGYLKIARNSYPAKQEYYFACQDFRKPSQVVRQLQQKYAGHLAITYQLSKDKYWQALDVFDI